MSKTHFLRFARGQVQERSKGYGPWPLAKKRKNQETPGEFENSSLTAPDACGIDLRKIGSGGFSEGGPSAE
jgi:hypothetical protein